jgi:hypothetical protein
VGAFGVVGKSLTRKKRFNGIYFGKIWNEKSFEDVVTLGPTAQATLVY